MYISTWQQAEQNAAHWMRGMGYPDAVVTVSGPDAGIDVRALGAVAQVKREAAQTGRPALQRLYGARGSSQVDMLFFSAAGFSRTAVEYADDADIGLFTYDIEGRVSPISGYAWEIVRRAQALQQWEYEQRQQAARVASQYYLGPTHTQPATKRPDELAVVIGVVTLVGGVLFCAVGVLMQSLGEGGRFVVLVFGALFLFLSFFSFKRSTPPKS